MAPPTYDPWPQVEARIDLVTIVKLLEERSPGCTAIFAERVINGRAAKRDFANGNIRARVEALARMLLLPDRP